MSTSWKFVTKRTQIAIRQTAFETRHHCWNTIMYTRFCIMSVFFICFKLFANFANHW